MTHAETDDGVYVGDVAEDGAFTGRGAFMFHSGDRYEGDFFNDEYHGTGRYLWADGTRYDGGYCRHKQHGYGVLTTTASTYAGEWREDARHGRGEQRYADGSTYVGEWVNGKRHGRGEHVDGTSRYVGEWIDDLKHGEGVLRVDGDVYEGEFAFDTPHGRGTFYGPQGGSFVGTFHRGLRHGEGIENHPDGSKTVGRWTHNEPPNRPSPAHVPLALLSNGGGTPEDVPTVDDLQGWVQVRTIGRGSFGTVFEAALPTGRLVCAKVVEMSPQAEATVMTKLQNEIGVMSRLHHKHIVRYLGCLNDRQRGHAIIFMEYVPGGTLNDYLRKFSRKVPQTTLSRWVHQIVLGVAYLHSQGVVHRDIKGDNILMTTDGDVKLADFGCSKTVDAVAANDDGCKTMVGTPYWMAPEVIHGEGYGMKSDVWSIGCTIVEMLTGKPPWPESTSMWAAMYKIANSSGLPTEIPRDLPPPMMDFLRACFERNHETRVTASQLLDFELLAAFRE